MVDISKAKSDLSPCIQFVVNWLEDNGFDATLVVLNTKKTVFEVRKDGVSDRFELTASREKLDQMEQYMSLFAQSFESKCENERLKRELKAAGILTASGMRSEKR